MHLPQDDRGILLNAVCEFLEKSFHLIHVSPHLAWPTVVSTFLYDRFLNVHLVRLLLTRCHTRRWVHPRPLCKEGYALSDWLNNHLSQVIGPSLSSKSAANTLRLSYLRHEAVSTRTLTISRPLWMRLSSTTQQTWDGWLHHCFLRSAK